jgi:aryl-alcohol dehydrogenase-like predicted oxidoreductase
MIYSNVDGVSKPVSRVALGTAHLNIKEYDQAAAIFDAAVDLGCTTFDLAHVYGGGGCERAVGQWLGERRNRDKIVILTKGCHHNGDRKRVTPFDIAADLHDSLARLKTDYIDIYLLHRDDPEVPVGPIVEAFNEHKRAGRIRAFGGSNWTHQRLQEANDYARAKGLTPLSASSPNFGLAEQVEDPWGGGCVGISGPTNADARAWYKTSRMPIFAYSSLARGFFSGRMTRENYTEVLDKWSQKGYAYEQNFRRLDRVQQLAREKGVSVPQIAMAYIVNQGLDVHPLVGANTKQELADSIAGCELKLTPEECDWLDLRREARSAKA